MVRPPGEKGQDWQAGAEKILADEGLQPDQWFNPKVYDGDGEYTAEHLAREAEHLRSGQFHYFKVEDKSAGSLSGTEAGAVTWRANCTPGVQAFFDIADLRGTGKLTESDVRARSVVKDSLGLSGSLRAEGITTSDTMSGKRWLKRAARIIRAGETTPARDAAPIRAPKGDLERRVFVSGTGAPATDTNAKGKFVGALVKSQIPLTDSFSPASQFGRKEIEAEAAARRNSAVVAHLITNDRLSSGAVGQTFWLADEAISSGQRFGVYIEPTDDAKLRQAAQFDLQEQIRGGSYPDNTEKYIADKAHLAAKNRRTVVKHLGATNEDFPGGIYEARSPEELAEWAVNSLAEMAGKGKPPAK